VEVGQFQAVDLYCIGMLASYIQVSICYSRLCRQYYGRNNTGGCRILVVDALLYQMSAGLLALIW